MEPRVAPVELVASDLVLAHPEVALPVERPAVVVLAEVEAVPRHYLPNNLKPWPIS